MLLQNVLVTADTSCGSITCTMYTDSGRTTIYSGGYVSMSEITLTMTQNIDAGYTTGSVWFTCANSHISIQPASEG